MNNNPLEAAYLSAVLLAGSLAKENHPKAAQALALKNAIAKAITHPDTMREVSFTEPWNNRNHFTKLKLKGETAELVTKHASILADTNLNNL